MKRIIISQNDNPRPPGLRVGPIRHLLLIWIENYGHLNADGFVRPVTASDLRDDLVELAREEDPAWEIDSEELSKQLVAMMPTMSMTVKVTTGVDARRCQWHSSVLFLSSQATSRSTTAMPEEIQSESAFFNIIR